MKLYYLILSLAIWAPSSFGAKAIATYRNEEYDVTGVKNENVIVRINNRLRTIKAERITLDDDAANQYPAVVADIDKLLVTLKFKGTRSLIIEADITVSKDLTDCFILLVSGSSNDVNTVVRALPDLSADQPSKISFTIKTGKFTKMEPYRLCLFSEGKSIVLQNGSDIVTRRITPYEQMPRALFQVDAIFPESLRDQYSQATVLMEFTIGEDGNAIDVKPLESPNELFSKSAIESLQKSRFGPRYVQGVPKSTRIKQAIVFRNQKPAMNRASAK